MGLRFRKSITLGKGVRLNLGKTGASLSVGGHGIRKSFHTSGRVTTTVGIPGTGLYWVDTKNSKKKKTNRTPRSATNYIGGTQSASLHVDGTDPIREYSSDSVSPAENKIFEPVWLTETADDIQNVDNSTFPSPYVDQTSDPVISAENNTTAVSSDEPHYYLTEEYIRNLYVQCDESIDWGEILAGTSADELFMDKAFWQECKKHCAKIMAGDTDSYLEVIEEFRPVDDILLYAGEFEFGTDARNYVETEFRVNPEDIIEGGTDSPLFEDFIYSVSIRVARDLMALLPVKKVLVHVEYGGNTIFSSIMDKQIFSACDFNREPLREIIKRIDYVSGIEPHRVFEVDRKTM